MATSKKSRRRRGALIPTSPRPKPSARKGVETPKIPLSLRLRGLMARRETLGTLVLCLLVGVAFYPATQAGFLWDDVIFTDSEPIRSPSGIWRIWLVQNAIDREGHYWPLLYSTFWLEHKLWAFDSVGYHVVNTILHLANVLLLWRILHRLAIPGAWIAAALFAVHPTHVEPVAWVIARKDLLATLLSFASILAWIRFTETSRKASYLQSLGFYVASMLCKSTAVTLAPIFLVLEWWKKGRITGIDLLRVAPFFAVGTWITLADLAFYQSRDASSFSHTFFESTLIAARAFWFYLGKLFWPGELAVIYPRWEIDVTDPLAWGYVVAGLALAAALWFFRSRIGRGPLAGALFYVITLLPVLGFVGYSYMQFSFVADRYQYLSGVGPIVILAAVAVTFVNRLPRAVKIGAATSTGLALVLLGFLTWKQAEHYESELTLFRHIVSLNPEAYAGYANLAKGYLDAGSNEEAREAALAAVELEPTHGDAHINLAVAYGRLGQHDDAETHYRRALEILPYHREALNGLSEILIIKKRYKEARRVLSVTLEGLPNYAPAYAELGDVLLAMKKYDEAIETLERAISLGLRPIKESKIRVSLGRALEVKERPEEARAQYQTALGINPDHWGAVSFLTKMLFEEKSYEEAEGRLRDFIQRKPNDIEAHYNLGVVLGHAGQFEESRRNFNLVLAINPDHAGSQTGLTWLEGKEKENGSDPQSDPAPSAPDPQSDPAPSAPDPQSDPASSAPDPQK